MGKTLSRWWFQIFFISTPTRGRFPFWLIFFNWVETTKSKFMWLLCQQIRTSYENTCFRKLQSFVLFLENIVTSPWRISSMFPKKYCWWNNSQILHHLWCINLNYQPQLVFTPDFWTINSSIENFWMFIRTKTYVPRKTNVDLTHVPLF